MGYIEKSTLICKIWQVIIKRKVIFFYLFSYFSSKVLFLIFHQIIPYFNCNRYMITDETFLLLAIDKLMMKYTTTHFPRIFVLFCEATKN